LEAKLQGHKMHIKLLFVIISSVFISNAQAASTTSKPPQYSIQGERRAFNRPVYGTNGNLASNSSFSTGTSGWKMTNLTDSRENPLYSVVQRDTKNWLRINQGIQTGSGKQGLMEQTVSIPVSLRDKVLEVSFLVSGLFTGFKVTNGGTDFVFHTKIDPTNPERIYYYYRPNGASSFTLSFMKGYPGQSVAGEYFDITEVAVREATWKNESISKGLPASGGTLQLARWLSVWDEKSQHKQLTNIRKMGGVVRVWLSGELFGSYTNKINPTKRNSSNLTSQYKNAKSAKVFTGLDTTKVKQLDWFFKAAHEHGLKVIVTLYGGFTDSAGNPHAKLSVPQSLEFVDTDNDVRSGFNSLTTAIVFRYASYDNISAWELVNEGWVTWRGSYAGYSNSAPYSTERSLSFAGYRSWERSAYLAVKAADPKRPVMLNSGGSDSHYLLHTDTVCDWSGVSLYLGSLKIANSSGTPSNFRVNSGRTDSLTNGTPLKAFTTGSFPNGIDSSTIYYVVNVTPVSFQVAASPGGPGINAKGGSGVLTFYSTDGTSLAAFDHVFQRWADFPKPTVVAEMGAPNEVGNLYRDDNYEAPYLKEGFRRLQRYGFMSGIVFDEFPGVNILWDANYNLNKSGKVTESAGPTIFKK
jgi:hypothetical protein